MSDPSGPDWDARRYDTQYGCITRYGADVVELLSPQPVERILDLGCGTGHLTQKIAEAGASVVGLDHSPQMIEEARKGYPDLQFVQADAADFTFEEPFDAVFSSAALHWMKPPERVVECVSSVLKEGGRFVAEMGGKGNIGRLIRGAERALESVGMALQPELLPWYFPSIAEYGTLLERSGMELVNAVLFSRPTAIEGDLIGWMEVFWPGLCEELLCERSEPFYESLDRELRAELFREGVWTLDYRRLRFVAIQNKRQMYSPDHFVKWS